MLSDDPSYRRVTLLFPFLKALPKVTAARVPLGLPAHARLGKGRHAVVTGDGGLEDRHGERRARGLAQPHIHVEQRTLANRLEQAAMAGLGRAMRHATV